VKKNSTRKRYRYSAKNKYKRDARSMIGIIETFKPKEEGATKNTCGNCEHFRRGLVLSFCPKIPGSFISDVWTCIHWEGKIE
jgi:hypothetical protein